MHYVISMKLLGQTLMCICSNIYDQTFWIFEFLCVFGFLHTQKQRHKSKIKNKNKNKSNAYKEMHNAKIHDNKASNAWKVLQRSKELDQGPKEHKLNHRNLHHPNEMIVWNECLMRSETRVGKMRTEDAHRQGDKNIKNFLQQLTIFPQIRFCFHSTTSKKLKFLFSFNSFKSLKLKAMRSKMTKGTIVVTNNEFMSLRFFKEGSSNMILFFLQQGTLRSYVTDYTTMVASWNKLKSIQNLRLKPKWRLKLKSLSLHFWFCTLICL